MAFLESPQWSQPYTDRSIDYLIRKSQKGKVDDFGGTIMAAQVFDAYLNANDLIAVYQTIQISRSKELLLENKQLKKDVETLTIQIDEYDAKYKEADIILSKKDAWKLGIWFGLITLILGIIVPVLINLLVIKFIDDSSHNPISTTYNYVQESFLNDFRKENLFNEIES